MSKIELFPHDQIIGTFRGFREGGLEFHADLTLPYRNDFQSRPMHGHFLLVQLETADEAVLGRITSFSSDGRLSSSGGDEYSIRAMRERRATPEDLREDYLKYRVNIRVLGVLRCKPKGGLTFIASHRRLPHVGSWVAFPSEHVIKEIAGHNSSGAGIGYFALGEYIYSGTDSKQHFLGTGEDWMQLRDPQVLTKFPVTSLVSRRTFVFARAGFGKSNLNKLLFSQLYSEQPQVTKRNERRVPVGTIIFDPDGEYFWPDDKGRPGLCDVVGLQDSLVVFTSREAPSQFYKSFIGGTIRLDIRRMSASDVVGIALPPEKQDQQNVRKLRQLSQTRWLELVDLVAQERNQADLDKIKIILNLEHGQDAEALAARANITTIINAIHDPRSRLLDQLIFSLKHGKLCIVDVSQMRGAQSMILAGLILRYIFDRNQKEFTKAEPDTVPTIVVIEEAQSVLVEGSVSAEPFIAWVKEGRKYDLGAVLITQQPGSIPDDILSQGDNWFVFHLLSSGDLYSIRKANAHFSDDILSSLLNEPIPGQGVFWSSVEGLSYPVSMRVLPFERMNRTRDPKYNGDLVDTFARTYLAENFRDTLKNIDHNASDSAPEAGSDDSELDSEYHADFDATINPLDEVLRDAIGRLNHEDRKKILDMSGRGTLAWRWVGERLARHIPETFDNRRDIAMANIAEALNQLFGFQDEFWETYRHDSKLYIRIFEGD